MNLVMFDIDGTLTNTNDVDNTCFVKALSEVLGIEAVDTDWTTYKNVTDQGCLEEFVFRHLGRAATQEESNDIKKYHIELLEKQARAKPELFAPIAGAVEMIGELGRRPETIVSLATGAWLESAEIKLREAGFVRDGIPMATANEAVAREEIMMLAERRAAEKMSVGGFETRTYVGDALWDVRAANELGYNFIGIAEGGRADALRNAGARWVLRDFADKGRVREILQTIWDD